MINLAMSTRSLAGLAFLAMKSGGIHSAVAQSPSTIEKIATHRGADRTQMLLEGARKEGKVVFYSGMIVDQALRPLVAGFSKKYPFIKAQYVRLGPSEMLQNSPPRPNC